MKYGEIKWKIEKVIFKAKDGVITQKSEIDEGKALITKTPQSTINTRLGAAPAHPC